MALLRSAFSEWNELGFDLVVGAERGPTISSRFYGLLNQAMLDAVHLVEGLDPSADAVLLQALGQHSVAVAAYECIVQIGLSLLDDAYLENRWELSEGTGLNTGKPEVYGDDDSAHEQSKAILSRAKQLLRNAEMRLGNAKDFSEISASLGSQAARNVVALSRIDGADQEGGYQGNSDYQIRHWIEDRQTGPLVTRPVSALGEPLSNKQINYNFYDESRWLYRDFDPNVALSALGPSFAVSEKGVLSSTSDPGFAIVNPAIASGQTRLTVDWQSISDWGIFPTIDDGGTQVPLTPHWGDVSVYAFDRAEDYRLDRFALPYLGNGGLNPVFVEEARELVRLSQSLQSGRPGAPNRRAIAEYWEYGDGTGYPPGHWLNLSRDVLLDDRIRLSRQQAADLSFAVAQAVRDSGAVAWGVKYELDTVRPFTAINQLFFGSLVPDWQGDDLAQTDDREGWNPYQLRRNYTPPFPDIVSGHSAFSTSSAVVLRGLLGGNYYPKQSVPFQSRFSGEKGFDGIEGNGNEERVLQWDYFSQQAEEAGFSRMLGGIHMASGNLEGLKLGVEIGHRILKRLELEDQGIDLAGNVTQLLQDKLPGLHFGTLGDDRLLETLSAGVDRAEIYGFAGDDLVAYRVAEGARPQQVSLFGGLGLDTFRVDGNSRGPVVRLADYQRGETIEVEGSSLIRDVAQLSFDTATTNAGLSYTKVLVNGPVFGEVLFELDGVFDESLLANIVIV